MIRFRVGDRFRAALAGDGAAVLGVEDALGIEVDGVEISGGVLEDPLVPAVAALATAVADLATGEARLAAVPFADGRIELSLARRGDQVTLSLVSLARPARVLVRDLAVELLPLCDAAGRCARELLAALATADPAAGRSGADGPAARLAAALKRLSRPRDEADEGPAPAARIQRRPAAASAPAFGFDLRDDEGRLAAWGGEPGLHALLAPGHVYVHGPDGEELLAVAGSPFLLLRDLAHAAFRLLRAARDGSAAAALPLGDAPPLEVDLAGGAITVAGRTLRCPPEAVARAAFEATLDLAGALVARNARLAENPYLASLVAESRERLELCRERAADERTGTAPSPPAAPPRPTGVGRPLAPGALRRVALRLAWRAFLPPLRSAVRVGDTAWLLTDEGVAGLALADGSLARGFESRGRVHLSAAGSRSPLLLLDERGRVEGRHPDGRIAWIREGPAPARELAPRYAKVLPERGGPLGVVLAEGRILLGLALQTGRTVFRLAPPGASRIAAAVGGSLAAVAADTGLVYGLDASRGSVAWRARLDEPATAVALAGDRVVVATAGRGGVTLHGFEARTGARAFQLDPGLAAVGTLRPIRGGVVVTGAGADGGEVLELGATGELRWRIGPFAGKAPAVGAAGGALFVRGRDEVGRIDAGRRTWTVAAGPGAAPVVCRGVVALPGERLLLLDAATGRELPAAVPGGSLPAADHVLGSPEGILVVADREGATVGLALAGAFGVIPGQRPRFRGFPAA